MDIWKGYRNVKIRNKLFIVFSSILLLYAVLGAVLIQLMSIQYDKNLYTQASSELNLMSHIVNRALQQVATFSFQVQTNPDIQSELAGVDHQLESYQGSLVGNALYQRLTSLVEQNSYLSVLEIIPHTGEHFTVGFNGHGVDLNPSDLARISAARGSNVWLVDGKQPGYVISARQIRQASNLSLQDLGVLIMQVDVGLLINEYLHLDKGEAVVVTQGAQVVYSSMPDLNSKLQGLQDLGPGDYRIVSINHRRFFVTHLNSGYDNFNFFNVVPYNDRFPTLSSLRMEMFGMYFLLFVFSEVMALNVSRRISRPIEILTREIWDVQHGKATLANARTSGNLGHDEIGVLYEDFHKLLERIDYLIQENYVKELLVTRTELQALQAQINPHFLYNTLNSINWIARMNNQQTISEMIEALGGMSRAMMDRRKTIITIGEEMDITKDYLKIQRIRFGARLQAEFEVDAETVEYMIPKLTIQPIVENAIVHGLEQMIGPCHIRIGCHCNDAGVVITIADNGPGIDMGRIHEILGEDGEPTRAKIGLANIHKRIRVLYGTQYGVRIHPHVNQGTVVQIQLPAELTAHW